VSIVASSVTDTAREPATSLRTYAESESLVATARDACALRTATAVSESLVVMERDACASWVVGPPGFRTNVLYAQESD
jgi:hypothetical protein